MDKARGLGNGLLADLVRDAAEHRAEEGYELRASANDLCLKADGKMTRDDHRQIEAWALKVREMVLEINQRRKDTDELYDERLATLDQAWEKFREIGPKEVVGDEKLARELKDRFGSEWGFGEYLGLGMGAQAIRDLLTREDLERPRWRPPRPDRHLEGPEAAARDQAAEGRRGVPQVREQARVDGPRRRAGDPAGAAPDGAAGRRPVRHQRPERPLPARHQPQQPPEAAARSRRARDHREQREADAAGGRRRPVRQRPPRSRGDGPGQPAR